MRTTTRVIESVWMRIQDEFLNRPTATLTAEEIRQRAATDVAVADAVLDALVESGVVERVEAGFRLARPHQIAA